MKPQNVYNRQNRTGFRPLVMACAVASCFSSIPALALPNGGSVAAGTATFSQSGSALTVTNTPGTIINWNSFSVGALESVRFNQQSSLSAILNRVTGASASAIHGAMSSNGRVLLVNPNGILFGAGSRIDVNGLVASTLNINDSDFLAGRLNFTAGTVAGNLRNEGTLQAAGGNIYLIAPNIDNAGIVRAPGGEVLLAAGRQISLVDGAHPDIQVVVSAPEDKAVNLGDLVAGKVSIFGSVLQQKGVASANTVEVDDKGRIVFRADRQLNIDAGSRTTANGASGGSITLQTRNGDTFVSGSVEARGTTNSGGTIAALGQRVAVTDNAVLDASGESGGGRVMVGGDYQGKNAAIQNAQVTYFGQNATVKANAEKVGDGGTAIVWADGTTRAYGSIEAKGGAEGGNGGFVEVSGKGYLDFNARVTTAAPNGKAGTLLLDPTDIVIGSVADIDGALSGATNDITLATDLDSALADFTGATSLITAGQVASLLNSGDLLLDATNDITVSNPISKTGSTPTTLRLHADNNIFVNAAISTSTGPLHLEFISDNNGSGGGAIKVTANLQTGGGNILMAGGTGTTTAVGNSAIPHGVWITGGAVVNALGGNLIMKGKGEASIAGSRYGVMIDDASVLTSGAGFIDMVGTGGGDGVSGSDNIGIYLGQGVLAQSYRTLQTENGSITILGTGGPGYKYNHGVYQNGSIQTDTGAISITGYGSLILAPNPPGGETFPPGLNDGVLLGGSSLVSSIGSATPGVVSILGTGGYGTSGYASNGVNFIQTAAVTSLNADINIQGIAGATGSGGYGVYLQGASTGNSTKVESTGAGNITIDGTGSPGGGTGFRIVGGSFPTSVSTGTGNVLLKGGGSGGQDQFVLDNTGGAIQITSGSTSSSLTLQSGDGNICLGICTATGALKIDASESAMFSGFGKLYIGTYAGANQLIVDGAFASSSPTLVLNAGSGGVVWQGTSGGISATNLGIKSLGPVNLVSNGSSYATNTVNNIAGTAVGGFSFSSNMFASPVNVAVVDGTIDGISVGTGNINLFANYELTVGRNLTAPTGTITLVSSWNGASPISAPVSSASAYGGISISGFPLSAAGDIAFHLGPGYAATIASNGGAVTTQQSFKIFGNLSNSGSITIGNGNTPELLDVSGNYVQGTSGSLNLPYLHAGDKIQVGGAATVSGVLDVTGSTPGTYSNAITATNGLSGSFSFVLGNATAAYVPGPPGSVTVNLSNILTFTTGGEISTAWNDPFNWSGHIVPTSAYNVDLGAFPVTTTANAFANNLTCSGTCALTIGSGTTLTLAGNGTLYDLVLQASSNLTGSGGNLLTVTNSINQASTSAIANFNRVAITQASGPLPLNVGNISTSFTGGFVAGNPSGVISLTASGGGITQQAGTSLAGSAVRIDSATDAVLNQANPTGIIVGRINSSGNFSYRSINPIRVAGDIGGISGVTSKGTVVLNSAAAGMAFDQQGAIVAPTGLFLQGSGAGQIVALNNPANSFSSLSLDLANASLIDIVQGAVAALNIGAFNAPGATHVRLTNANAAGSLTVGQAMSLTTADVELSSGQGGLTLTQTLAGKTVWMRSDGVIDLNALLTASGFAQFSNQTAGRTFTVAAGCTSGACISASDLASISASGVGFGGRNQHATSTLQINAPVSAANFGATKPGFIGLMTGLGSTDSIQINSPVNAGATGHLVFDTFSIANTAANPVTAGRISGAADGNVTLFFAGGDTLIGTFTVPASPNQPADFFKGVEAAGTMALTHVGTSGFLDGGGVIKAANLNLKAGYFGSEAVPLRTWTSNLLFEALSGGAYVVNHDAANPGPLFASGKADAAGAGVALTNYGATTITVSGVSADGTIVLAARSPLTIDGPVTSTSGGVTLEAASGGALTVNQPVKAKTSVSLTSTGTVSGSGTVTDSTTATTGVPLNCKISSTSPECQAALPTADQCKVTPSLPGCSLLPPPTSGGGTSSGGGTTDPGSTLDQNVACLIDPNACSGSGGTVNPETVEQIVNQIELAQQQFTDTSNTLMGSDGSVQLALGPENGEDKDKQGQADGSAQSNTGANSQGAGNESQPVRYCN